MNRRRDYRPDRLARSRAVSPMPHKPTQGQVENSATVDCGWGKLIFAQTFADPEAVAKELLDEGSGRRHIAMYVQDPHVILAQAPQALFMDPSHTYRLMLSQFPGRRLRPKGFSVRRLRTRGDGRGIKRIYERRNMVPVEPRFVWDKRTERELSYIIAEDHSSGKVIGTATGIDHKLAFDDPQNGSSLWCLAVDPQATHPGIGEALVRYLAEHYQARGRDFMDLSVLHDNEQAIALYNKLGFRRVPVFAIKRKNAINESLFVPAGPERKLNPYAQIIVDEALRRGIEVDILDAEEGYFRLSHGGRHIACRESLSELTTAVAMSRCQDKRTTYRVLEPHGIRLPGQCVAGDPDQNFAFLKKHKSVVVKPANGEQGQGISVGVTDEDHLAEAIKSARKFGERVLLEEYVAGQDLRLIVIGFKLVAAAIRKPASITGTGEHSIEKLIRKQSRRRSAATGGESRIPMDAETRRCVHQAGYEMGDVLPAEEILEVRKTANLHTGGTIHDVTEQLHPSLASAAETCARALDIPVVGLDFIARDVTQPRYVFIEANERAGLANHEPQPTAERFIDLLFPYSGRKEPE